MRFSTQTIDDRAKQKWLSRQFVVLPFRVAKGFHPDVMVPEILAVVTPLPKGFWMFSGNFHAVSRCQEPALPAWRIGFHLAHERM
jgi:hypothetical protein